MCDYWLTVDLEQAEDVRLLRAELTRVSREKVVISTENTKLHADKDKFERETLVRLKETVRK